MRSVSTLSDARGAQSGSDQGLTDNRTLNCQDDNNETYLIAKLPLKHTIYRALHGAEKTYGISKLELLLAVVWALELYRPYLLGFPFKATVISDHSALPELLKTKQPTGILARWIEKLSEFDFTIVYRPSRTS
ncbi:hypothetical protein HMPREF1544_03454 [Mucor circinelloides 1006PhL]|uniref:Reverse transcriptase RNase H-like domain-containing protein n=1 Tax=Mucor circinelloides f. circinelloides (strain 1006PhL) TaxID=1220926 RepID=S2JH53_MUCC1|nr:hypothetical protein HMPREF1544_03454 [Mucor circinelloides 1006PhL]